jgi:acetyl-CoA C-acetyltransferase
LRSRRCCMTEVYVVSGVRTAIGSFGGSLKEIPPSELASRVTAEAVRRASVAPADIGHVVFGQVVQTEPRDMYVSRVAAVDAGIPVETPALTVNRLCGSGLQAVVSAAQSIKLGDCDVAVAGGVESMSRAPFQAPSFRWGTKMGSAPIVDVLDNALRDPFHRVLMGVTAENVAERHGISRDDQDALALESHRRASAASKAGYFNDQILGIEIKSRKGAVVFDADEHVRHDAGADDFKALRPVFKRDGGSVTAGNASGINDGAAAVVLASEAAVGRLGLKPMARLVAYAHAGVEPLYMGLGPIPATRLAVKKAGVDVADMDVIESNEAFAAQACAVARELGFDAAKVNPNGSGISLGHPVGATGAINTVKAVYELARTGKRYALVTMCIGGGQGIAAIFERS